MKLLKVCAAQFREWFCGYCTSHSSKDIAELVTRVKMRFKTFNGVLLLSELLSLPALKE